MQSKKTLSAVNVFAIVIGIFLLIEGFWGLFDPMVFGIFSTNFLHAFIHLVLGFSAIYLGLRGHARKFILFLGILLGVVGLLYFVPGAGHLVIRFFNVNNAVAVLNIIAAMLCFLFVYLTPKRKIAG